MKRLVAGWSPCQVEHCTGAWRADRLSGRVLDANAMQQGQLVPLLGVTVSFLASDVSALSDAEGYFALPDVPAGAEVLDIDASTAIPGPGRRAVLDTHNLTGSRSLQRILRDYGWLPDRRRESCRPADFNWRDSTRARNRASGMRGDCASPDCGQITI